MRLFSMLFRAIRTVPETPPPVRSARVRSSPRPVRRPRDVQDKAEVERKPTTQTLKGKCYVIDGDTVVISGTKIRIGGIDAPELNHPYGKSSKFALIKMCKGKVITAIVREEMSYDRVVASCYLPDGTDVAEKLVEQGLALDWARFSGGAYRHLEPPDARKKLWRADAKQKGRLHYVERYDGS